MSTRAEKAADVLACINERPSTITVIRRAVGATSETTVDTFTGRVDEAGRSSVERQSPDGTVSRHTHILLCPQAHRVVRRKDTIKEVTDYEETRYFRVLFVRDLGYKQECDLEFSQ